MNNLDLSVRYREWLPRIAAKDVPQFSEPGRWPIFLSDVWSRIESAASAFGWNAFSIQELSLAEAYEKFLGFESEIYGGSPDSIKESDWVEVLKKDKDYGASWKRRGGIGAFMMLCRKWDRIENFIKKSTDFEKEARLDKRAEGLRDDVSDLRRYILLVRSEIRFRLPYTKRGKTRSGNCELCGVFRKHLDRDHIIPRWKGGGEEKENIQFICQNCHKDKSCEDARGCKFSEESRAKMRASSRKFWDSPRSAEARKNISEATKLRPSPRKGVKASKETRERLRVSHLGNKHSPEAKAKILAAIRNNENLKVYYRRGQNQKIN
jgi:5-methylcytosine-specific restriction endonuclease McrA